MGAKISKSDILQMLMVSFPESFLAAVIWPSEESVMYFLSHFPRFWETYMVHDLLPGLALGAEWA